MQRHNIGLHGCLVVTAVDIYCHTESFCNGGNLAADVSVTNDSQRFTGKLHQWFLHDAEISRCRPFSIQNCLVMECHVACKFQKQGKGVLCHRVCGITGYIADCNAAFFCCCQIDIVITGCQYSDKFQVWAGIHDFRSDSAFIYENRVSTANGFCDVFFWNIMMYGQLTQCFQCGPGQVARINGMAFYDGNLHGSLPP